MSTYDTLRHFADTWGLVALLIFFIAVVLWVFRPGSRKRYRDAAQAPFKHDEPADRKRAEDR